MKISSIASNLSFTKQQKAVLPYLKTHLVRKVAENELLDEEVNFNFKDWKTFTDENRDILKDSVI